MRTIVLVISFIASYSSELLETTVYGDLIASSITKYTTATSLVEINHSHVTRPHPFVSHIPGHRTSAVAAKFRSLSSRPLDMWWDDSKDGVYQGRLMPGKESTTNSYQSHVFFFTDINDKTEVVTRIKMKSDTVLYPVRDAKFPASQSILDQSTREEAFGEEYFARTGIKWRHFFNEKGPRPPPVLNMWPGDFVGQIHAAKSLNSFWTCSDYSDKTCQSSEPVNVQIECVSTHPRVFVIENFLSNAEADAIISLARPKVKESTVGNMDGGGVRASTTRTSHNTWIPRHTSEITETITRRVADVLGLDEKILSTSENAEDMQVVHYVNGQKYDSHHDWGVSGYPESRFITMLMYLSDQEDSTSGGETAFPKAGGAGGGIKVKPVKGTAVVFYNLLEDGNGDDLALHAALPVVRGEKWLANFWIWDPKRK